MNLYRKIRKFLRIHPEWKRIFYAALLVVFCFCIFFFVFFKVNTVVVMDSRYYSEEEIKAMVLKGPFAYNSVLAPIFCSGSGNGEAAFVEGFTVTHLSRNSICITVDEDIPVGCIRYLDSYIYFDRNGVFIDSVMERDENIPFYSGIVLDYVLAGEELPIRKKNLLDSAVILAEIFQKNDSLPDYITMDNSGNLSMQYGDIVVQLGQPEYLEDKMARVLAILPKLEGETGTLHLENVNGNVKTVTFELDDVEYTYENWPGGYEKDGEYTGEGEYNERGRYVGPRPLSEYEYAIAAWPGGYDSEGDYTGAGPYDESGEYVGEAPTEESIAANGSWKGGYDENGRYVTSGQYDHDGNFVGPNPAAASEESSQDEEENDSGSSEDYYDTDEYDDSYYDDDYDSYDEDYDSYDEDYDSYDYEEDDWDDGYEDDSWE
jgi:cell division protein FtsQ